MDQAHAVVVCSLLAAALAGCGGDADAPEPMTCAPNCAEVPDDRAWPPELPYAKTVERFTAGEGAGFGEAQLPDIVLGPPRGRGPEAGGLDVLSLGVGGEIVLGFGEKGIMDGPGPDLIVFENPFYVEGDPTMPFVELGEVAVSTDAVTWHTFACAQDEAEPGRYPGCAGWTPTLEYDPLVVEALDPAITGGDGFDIGELGLTEARYVRITDLSTDGDAPTAGFDLDAVGLVHHASN